MIFNLKNTKSETELFHKNIVVGEGVEGFVVLNRFHLRENSFCICLNDVYCCGMQISKHNPQRAAALLHMG